MSAGADLVAKTLTERWRTLCTERGHHALAYFAREHGITLDGRQLHVVWSTAAREARRTGVDTFAALLVATGIERDTPTYLYAGVTCGAVSDDDPAVHCALAAGHGPVPDPEGEDRTFEHVAPGSGAWWNEPTAIIETVAITIALPKTSSPTDLQVAIDHVLAQAARAGSDVGATVTRARSW
ncbi:hypothetical protein [Cellulosimicrobium sp. Marseille-Q4280]|uniref:hypothetical protein n=1 Tax=Cellulosimicrobium sp. Marseille-Q4280 TaxID=2937992 RepID=UPI00203BA6D6|nr:hypothetical protein [Cellulosimicrobium sp. Marseille-Q4280]